MLKVTGVSLDHVVCPDLLVPQDQREPMEPMVTEALVVSPAALDKLVDPDPQEPLAKSDNPDLLELMAQADPPDQLVCQVLMVAQDRWDPLERPEVVDCRVLKDLRERGDPQEKMESPEPLVSVEPLVMLAPQESVDREETQDLRVKQVPLAVPALAVQLDSRDYLEPKAHPETTALTVRQECPETQVHQDVLDTPAREVDKEKEESLALLVRQDRSAQLDHPVLTDHVDPQDPRAKEEILDHQAQGAILENADPLVKLVTKDRMVKRDFLVKMGNPVDLAALEPEEPQVHPAHRVHQL